MVCGTIGVESLWRLLIRLLIPAGCLLQATGCAPEPGLEVSRSFQQAEKLFADAQSIEEYQRVASLYQEILDSGYSSGVVYYNQGNAWMQAGETGRG